MKILGIIPARGNSKSVKQKNMQKVSGQPLIYYTLKSALDSKRLNKIVVSSESSKIINYCKKKRVQVIKRPNSLSKDNSPTEKVINHTLTYLKKYEKYKPDLIVILQPTSPFRKSKDIDEAIKFILKDKNSDCLVSVQKVPHNFEPFSQMIINKKGYLKNFIKQKKLRLRKQDKQLTFSRNGAAIYIIKKTKNLKSILAGKILPYQMPIISSLDIDNIEDLKLCRIIANSKGFLNAN